MNDKDLAKVYMGALIASRDPNARIEPFDNLAAAACEAVKAINEETDKHWPENKIENGSDE